MRFVNFLHGIRRAMIFALVIALSVAPTHAAPSRSGGIAQVLLLWLKRPGNADDQNILIRAAHSFRRVKGVSEVRVGRAQGRPSGTGEQSFDVAIIITFKDRRAFERFERDERYQQLSKIALTPLVRRSIVYNFTNE